MPAVGARRGGGLAAILARVTGTDRVLRHIACHRRVSATATPACCRAAMPWPTAGLRGRMPTMRCAAAGTLISASRRTEGICPYAAGQPVRCGGVGAWRAPWTEHGRSAGLADVRGARVRHASWPATTGHLLQVVGESWSKVGAGAGLGGGQRGGGGTARAPGGRRAGWVGQRGIRVRIEASGRQAKRTGAVGWVPRPAETWSQESEPGQRWRPLAMERGRSQLVVRAP